MQGIYAQLTGGVHLPSIYMHCTRSSSGCSGMQGICAGYWSIQLTDLPVGVLVCHLLLTGGPYICIVLDLAVGVVVCKASVLNWLGVSICLLYICIVLDLAVGVMVCKASIFNWLCTGIQGIYAQLTGGSRSTSGCISMQGICLDWLVGSICLLYICIVLDLAVAVVVCKASIFNWLCTGIQGSYAQLTGGLDLPVAVSVCKASVLIDWWGPSAFYIYALY